jgi:hypothetical protein
VQSTPDPESVVQRQLAAYNARDIDALMSTYADDIELFEHPSKLLASGAAEVRERQGARLQELNLHAALVKRMVMGKHRHRPGDGHPHVSRGRWER